MASRSLACFTCSAAARCAGGGISQPTRRPGQIDFEKVPTCQTRSGASARSGRGAPASKRRSAYASSSTIVAPRASSAARSASGSAQPHGFATAGIA
ncbi:MAG: hypothetical protein DCC71_03135 [Proteobacteria bacterium]|nr:MAG: hypothetical protein DCC71_03135 [Pseudomonadota bacterium]